MELSDCNPQLSCCEYRSSEPQEENAYQVPPSRGFPLPFPLCRSKDRLGRQTSWQFLAWVWERCDHRQPRPLSRLRLVVGTCIRSRLGLLPWGYRLLRNQHEVWRNRCRQREQQLHLVIPVSNCLRMREIRHVARTSAILNHDDCERIHASGDRSKPLDNKAK